MLIVAVEMLALSPPNYNCLGIITTYTNWLPNITTYKPVLLQSFTRFIISL